MEKVEIKNQMTEVKTTTIFCDKCNNEIIKECYNSFGCTIRLRVGEYYGSHFDGDDYRVDLCEPCAKFVFHELLPNNGINITNEEDE